MMEDFEYSNDDAPLTHKELDFIPCTDCGEETGPIVLAAGCHNIDTPAVLAKYLRGGILEIYCPICFTLVVRIQVA